MGNKRSGMRFAKVGKTQRRVRWGKYEKSKDPA